MELWTPRQWNGGMQAAIGEALPCVGCHPGSSEERVMSLNNIVSACGAVGSAVVGGGYLHQFFGQGDAVAGFVAGR